MLCTRSVRVSVSNYTPIPASTLAAQPAPAPFIRPRLPVNVNAPCTVFHVLGVSLNYEIGSHCCASLRCHTSQRPSNERGRNVVNVAQPLQTSFTYPCAAFAPQLRRDSMKMRKAPWIESCRELHRIRASIIAQMAGCNDMSTPRQLSPLRVVSSC